MPSLVDQIKVPLILALIITFLQSTISSFLSPAISGFIPGEWITFVIAFVTIWIGLIALHYIHWIKKLNLNQQVMWAGLIALGITLIGSWISGVLTPLLGGMDGMIAEIIGLFVTIFVIVWAVMRFSKLKL